MKSGIYHILHSKTGHSYVGSSCNIGTRLKNHYRKLINNKHTNKKLQEFWNNHNPNDFVFEKIEFCDEKSLKEKEQYHMDRVPSELSLNLAPKAFNVCSVKSDRSRQREGETNEQHLERLIKNYKPEPTFISAEYIFENFEMVGFWIKAVKKMAKDCKDKKRTLKQCAKEWDTSTEQIKLYMASLVNYQMKYGNIKSI